MKLYETSQVGFVFDCTNESSPKIGVRSSIHDRHLYPKY